jgi:hypothetical protein
MGGSVAGRLRDQTCCLYGLERMGTWQAWITYVLSGGECRCTCLRLLRCPRGAHKAPLGLQQDPQLNLELRADCCTRPWRALLQPPRCHPDTASSATKPYA